MAVWETIGQAVQSVGAVGADIFDRMRGVTGSGPQSRQADFSMAVVALAAKMAKADGVVTMSEAASFWNRFDVPDSAQRPIRRLFDLAQQDVAGFEAYARKIARLFPDDDAVHEDILDILFTIAAADGVIHENELDFLERVAEIFGVDGVMWSRIKARHLEPDGDPFAVLGLARDADRATITRRYRELVREHHPDRLIARGVPEEFVRIATDRLAAINSAYDAAMAHLS
ncbi:DnaJ family molecular chaperone [Acuticoccus sp. I52.16.1]|uniref:J domain-containing protein n=1 Tax=Acuticoccus sp. I52.16.1 TaxID=2928472 RepID=UPI001FD4CA6C|nr:DnaJ family molecular chaperone [Acuticoccus sp. I52.16.1]UOM34396.1 DnaJ family molecular chaperone [Acuticoccus sp. I52.16.1]